MPFELIKKDPRIAEKLNSLNHSNIYFCVFRIEDAMSLYIKVNYKIQLLIY